MVRRIRSWVAIACLSSAVLAIGSPALADEHRSDRSGHPLRFFAYLVHPVGVALDTLIARPIHWLFHYEPFETLFGHED
jgi:hypothetical protein